MEKIKPLLLNIQQKESIVGKENVKNSKILVVRKNFRI